MQLHWKRAEDILVRAKAAVRCHDMLVSTANDLAVKQAVHIARLNPIPGTTADETELLLLETYLALNDDCPFCLAAEPRLRTL